MSQFGRIVKLLKAFFFSNTTLQLLSTYFPLVFASFCNILIINRPNKHNKKCNDPSKENLSVDNKT